MSVTQVVGSGVSCPETAGGAGAAAEAAAGGAATSAARLTVILVGVRAALVQVNAALTRQW